MIVVFGDLGVQKKKFTTHGKRKLLTLTECAAAIGVDHGQLSHERRRQGFPVHRVKGNDRFDPDEVQQWRARNIHRRYKAGMRSEKSRPRPPMEFHGPLEFARKILTTGTSSPLEISRAAVHLASSVVGVDGASPMAVDALKKSLEELRQAEGDYQDLAERRELLIARDDVERVVKTVIGRLIRCLDLFEEKVSIALGAWLADPEFRAMPSDAQARKIRQFVGGAAREIRQAEVDHVDAMVELEKEITAAA